jgi:hypothetical protein
LPTTFEADGFRTIEHVLQGHPAAPEDQPARAMITLAVLVAAQSSQGVEEIMDTQIHANFFVGNRSPEKVAQLLGERTAMLTAWLW